MALSVPSITKMVRLGFLLNSFVEPTPEPREMRKGGRRRVADNDGGGVDLSERFQT